MVNEKVQHAPWKTQSLFFGGKGVFVFLICFHYVPIKFPMCSYRCSLIAPHFIPYVLPKVGLLYEVINYKGGLKGNTSMLLFWEVSNVSKKM